MEAQKNIAEFQEKFVVPVPANIAKIVDERDRKILADSYLKLYSGFSWINWTNGHSLGRAWQTALTQCESFINTKKSNNPALKHLRNVFKSHKKYWSRVIMTHRDSGNKISGNADWVAHMRAYGMQLIREAMDKINLILSRYNERIEELQIERQNAQEHSVAHVQISGAAIYIAGASNTANAEQNINGAQTAKVQSAGNTNAQPMNENTPVAEQPVIAQQATQSQPKQEATQQQAVAQQQAATQQQAMAQSTVAQQNTATQAQKQSQQFALTEPVKTPQRAVSANAHKQALAHATEKLKQLQPAIAKQKESALHNITAQQVARPQVQVEKPKPQLSGLVQNRAQPKPRVASVAKLQSQIATPVPRKPQVQVARPQVQVEKPKPQLSGLVLNRVQPKPAIASVAKLQTQIATPVPRKPQAQVARPQVQVEKPKPQLSGLVQNRAQPKPAIASVAKLQTQANTVAKVPHRPNINMILFKNFNQRVA